MSDADPLYLLSSGRVGPTGLIAGRTGILKAGEKSGSGRRRVPRACGRWRLEKSYRCEHISGTLFVGPRQFHLVPLKRRTRYGTDRINVSGFEMWV